MTCTFVHGVRTCVVVAYVHCCFIFVVAYVCVCVCACAPACVYLPTTNTEALAAPNVEHATIKGITTKPASPIVLYPNG